MASADRPRRGASMPGMLVVTIDRLPAWILPAYGATWVSAPAIDGLAASGLLLDRLVATSLDPGRTLDAVMGGLPAELGAAGRGVRVVTDDATLAPCHGGPGVERVVVPAEIPSRRPRDAGRTALGGLFAAAHAALDAGPECLWVHATSLGRMWDAPREFHEPYVDADDPPPPSGMAVPAFAVDAGTDPDLLVGHRQMFAGQVSLLDRLLGGLLAAASGAGRGDWTVCLCGVRGLPLGLHGRMGPPADAAAERPFGESIHLPAILRSADGAMAGQRYGGIVVPADIGATLRDLAGLPAAHGTAGGSDARSLRGLLERWDHRRRDRAISAGAGGVAVTTDAWRWIGTDGKATQDGGLGTGRLHALPDDFFEMCDVADRCPAEAAALAHVAALAHAGRLDEAGSTPLGPAGGAAAAG